MVKIQKQCILFNHMNNLNIQTIVYISTSFSGRGGIGRHARLRI